MTEPLGEPLSTSLIERYLRTRKRRYFRGQHDGEFFFVINTDQRRLHVHIEIPPMHPDVLTIRITPACFFPADDKHRLERFADAWSVANREISVSVHGSSDPLRIGVTAHTSRSFGNRVRLEEFAAPVDVAIDAAIAFFAALTSVTELPATPLLRDAG